MPGFTIDDLLAHREWVGRVARTLVHGDAEAEDLEQRAWVRALEHPPAESPRSPRGWLRTVLRFAAIDGIRERATRRRHEKAAARTDRADAAPEALVARAEIHERLVHEVLELEEPYRGTILLRYFEDLPPREIAERQGVPVETVRTRVKRALEQLRNRLGGERGREGLLLSLAPLLLPEGRTVAAGTAGGIVMGTAAKIGLAAGVIVLAAGGVVAWQSARGVKEAPLPQDSGVAATPVPPVPSRSPAGASSAPPQVPPSPRPGPSRGEKAVPPGPTVEERLDGPIEDLRYEGTTVASIVMEMARRLDLDPEYASAELKRYCEVHQVFQNTRGIKFRQFLSTLLSMSGSPEEGKVMAFEVRGKALHVLLREPPPPAPMTPEREAKAQEALGKNTLNMLKSHRTTFVFDGSQNLEEAFSYLRAQQSLNIVVFGEATERCGTVKVKLSVKDTPVDEALDELLRLDPDLLWEVKGNLVVVRKR